MRTSLVSLLLAAGAAHAKYIVPGGRWHDTDGNLINAHAGGVTVDPETGKFFWFGEYKIEGQEEGGGVTVYSSEDLATWTYEGLALEPIEGHPYISTEHIIQRPKVAYSESADQYHMWWHADNSSYGWLLQGFATADTIAGPYTFVNATAPLGNWSQDFGMFTDYKDGKTYSLYSNGDRKEGRDVYLTSFNDEISELDEVIHRWDKFDLEAPTIIQTEKSYYALMSHKTGYRPNNVVAFRADSLAGPWSQPWIVAPLNTRTYNSQSGFSLRIVGEKKTTYLYLGDQNFASNGVIVTGIYGNDSTVTFEGIEGTGKDQWVSFYYQNTDDMGFGDQPGGSPDRIGGKWQLRRVSSVVVNGDTENVQTLYQRDTHKGIILSTPLLLPLKEGQNTITVGGLDNGFDFKGADLDKIIVYPAEE
ncbi:putative galactan -beta-galactosidase protein [Neofusicoccum parvum UCRNP2]|uniref:Putative galactan-beta-galactosidase protein n=1 Tax=Botryosphaeria parva (strain UCR-NP2) TaxID=1287680 RepID=R1GG59_BOTPV|nr:putative galactan -beta-galactosidase protein [Neofusicoccum parvum UCRNP2]